MSIEQRCKIGNLALGLCLGLCAGAFWTGHWILGGAVLALTLAIFFLVSARYVWWLPRRGRAAPLIFMLHSVSESLTPECCTNNAIRPADLEGFIKHMLDAGYTFQTLRESQESPCKWSAVMTFDDGYVDNYTTLLPILKKYHVKATFFVTNRLRDLYLNDAQLTACVASGLVELGGHTATHCNMYDKTDAELAEELALNKARLERIAGVPIISFAYPFGCYDARICAAVAKAGYKYAAIIRPIPKRATAQGTYQIVRQMLPRGLSPARLYLLATRGKSRL